MAVSFADAYRRDVFPATGGYLDAQEEVKRKISALTRNATGFWIGIASETELGMEARWNQKYKPRGFNQIALVYKTDSDNFRKQIEAELIRFYADHVHNEIGGGGGSAGTPPYAVYIVWKQ